MLYYRNRTTVAEFIYRKGNYATCAMLFDYRCINNKRFIGDLKICNQMKDESLSAYLRNSDNDWNGGEIIKFGF